MVRKLDLKGQTFDYLTVVHEAPNKGKNTAWVCRCDCGKEVVKSTDYLRSSRSSCIKSCGCMNPMASKDFTGMTFGEVTVLERVGVAKYGVVWRCRCSCGREFETVATSLNVGKVKRCPKSRLPDTLSEDYPIYQSWSNMKNRCLNPNTPDYHFYGARGITICNEWIHDFDAFYYWAKSNGWEEGLTIDRIDNSKGYSPDNCRWVDRMVQANNTRRTHLIEYNGETHSISEWARIQGMSVDLLKNRISRGVPIGEALTAPAHTNEDSKRRLTINGETHTVEEWSKISGIRKDTIFARLWKGWTDYDAVFRQPHQRDTLSIPSSIHTLDEYGVVECEPSDKLED